MDVVFLYLVLLLIIAGYESSGTCDYIAEVFLPCGLEILAGTNVKITSAFGR